jgi:hypothetical protein
MIRALLLLALLFSAPAWAVTYYAAPGGGAAATCADAAANVCTVARCITVAGNTDTCSLAAGTYPGSELGGSGYVIMTSELVNLVCAGAVGSCIFQPAGSNISGIRANSPPTGTLVLTGITIDGSGTTPLDQCFWYSDGAAAYSVTSTDNFCEEADIYMHRIVANEMTLASTRDTMTASTAVSPRSFVATLGTWAEGGVTVASASVTIDRYNDAATPIVNILASDAGETASVTNSTFTIANDPATLLGYIDVLQFIAVPNAVASGNTITVTGANVGPATGTACDASTQCRHVRAIKSYSTSALDSSGFIADDNVITLDTANGVMISAGDDGTSAGNTYSANGRISRNTLNCTTSGPSTHGVMFAWSQGGRGYRNKVTNCGIGLLSKDQPTAGALFSSNIIEGAREAYMYAKGSTAPQFANNTLAVSNTTGIPVVIGIDGATNSTNVSLYNNSAFSVNGITPANMVNTASSQTIAAASNNNWYGFTSPQWTYLGAAYTSLALWNAVAVVGTDVALAPGMVGGAAPAATAGYKLNSNSALIRGGLCYSTSGCISPDFEGRRAFVPPDIGAYQRVVGDP